MATGLMGAAAPAIELAVEGGVYRVFTQGVDRPQALRVRIENQANRPLAGIVAVTLLAGGPECSAPFAAPAGGQGTSTSPGQAYQQSPRTSTWNCRSFRPSWERFTSSPAFLSKGTT